MGQYEKIILNALLDKFESSLVYTGDNKKKQRVTYPVTKKTFPEYFDLSSMVYDQIHEEFLELESRGLVKLVWNSKTVGHVLKEVELDIGHADEIYGLLQRSSRSQLELQAISVLEELDGICDGVTECARKWMEERIRMGESIKKYVDISRTDEIRRLFMALHAVVSNQKEMYVREFSILHFHDTKAFEELEGKLISLICKFYTGTEVGLRELEDEQILNLFGIYKNPAYVMVKGAGILQLCSGVSREEAKVPASEKSQDYSIIYLDRLTGGIGIHSQDLKLIEFEKSSQVETVMTIENLTVFHRMSIPGSLLIYLGGYHTTARRQFLKKVYEAFPNARYLHFGDIDCGGFKILEDLKKKTGIGFLPYRMDIHTFLRYEEFCRPLTSYDRNELKRMTEEDRYEEYTDILMLMLEKKKKLEQECVGIDVFS